MEYTVFYSWQTDLPDKANRAFVKQALKDAVAAISEDGIIEDAPRADDGMDGVSGTPEVATVMFQKIQRCSVFVGDVSLVGIVTAPGGQEPKRLANSNVLLEMGYAAGWLGWDRVICVMNEHYGKRRDQPFDVRNRRYPIDYTLDPVTMNGETRTKKDLTRWLKKAIESASENEHARVKETVERLDLYSLKLIYQFGNQKSFAGANSTTYGHVVANQPYEFAIVRLLDMGIIRADVDPRQNLYAYHWTYFGKLVLKALKIENPAGDITRIASPTPTEAPAE